MLTKQHPLKFARARRSLKKPQRRRTLALATPSPVTLTYVRVDRYLTFVPRQLRDVVRTYREARNSSYAKTYINIVDGRMILALMIVTVL